MRESLEKYSTGFPDSNQKNSILIDLILLMDIFQTIKSAKYLIKGIIDKKLGDLSTLSISPSFQANLDQFIQTTKEECFDELEDRSQLMSGKPYCVPAKVKDLFEGFQKSK